MPSCSIVAYFSSEACPLCKDDAAYRFLHFPLGLHCAQLFNPARGVHQFLRCSCANLIRIDTPKRPRRLRSSDPSRYSISYEGTRQRCRLSVIATVGEPSLRTPPTRPPSALGAYCLRFHMQLKVDNCGYLVLLLTHLNNT